MKPPVFSADELALQAAPWATYTWVGAGTGPRKWQIRSAGHLVETLGGLVSGGQSGGERHVYKFDTPAEAIKWRAGREAERIAKGWLLFGSALQQAAELEHAPWSTYVYIGGGSRKFWQVRHAGRHVETRWGRIGSSGQRQPKTFATDQEAADHAWRMQAEKLAKGYVQEGSQGAAERIRESVSGVPLPTSQARQQQRSAVRPAAPQQLSASASSPVALGRFAVLEVGGAGEEDEL